ncbi:MAG: erythromycin esterase family protein [Bacteroidota bacterium]|nr:erythromycin esterase family protein [Bacteroidota bacterium]
MLKFKKIILLFAFIVSVQTLFGQTIKLGNTIQCIDTSDLSKGLYQLDKVFKESKIILLGEAGHGDGMTFQIKTKLIKYLVENYGYNTLALEGAGFVETPYGIQGIKSDSNIYKEFEKFWDFKWSKSEQTKALMKYTSEKTKQNKLNLFGFESQPNSTIYTKNLYPYLRNTCKTCLTGIDTNMFNNYVKGIFNYYGASAENPLDETDKTITSLDSLTKIFIKRITGNSYECSLFRQHLLNISSNLEIFIYNFQHMSYADQSVNIRDSVMASNLFWYLDRNPESKIIIWAANFHTIKDLSLITNNRDSMKYKSIIPMGKFISDKYPKNSYSIAFTSASGQAGFCADTISYNLEETAKFPIDNSVLEYSFNNNNCKFAFYSFSNDSPLKEKKFRSLIFGGNMHKGYWAKSFDGVIYIDKQTKSTLRKNIE